jgi:hypothetical protein
MWQFVLDCRQSAVVGPCQVKLGHTRSRFNDETSERLRYCSCLNYVNSLVSKSRKRIFFRRLKITDRKVFCTCVFHCTRNNHIPSQQNFYDFFFIVCYCRNLSKKICFLFVSFFKTYRAWYGNITDRQTVPLHSSPSIKKVVKACFLLWRNSPTRA